jgi:hypothetical protein
MGSEQKIIAVDFDGTLCEYAFPGIGKQTQEQKELMRSLILLRQQGHKLILWTNRGDNEKYPVLTEALVWCKDQGLEFDAVNENLPDQKKLSGPSPKIMADFYLDDKALHVDNWRKLLNE